MQANSENLSNRGACPLGSKWNGYIASGLIASTLMLNISIGNARELPQTSSAMAGSATNADNYRSSEGLNNNPLTRVNSTLPDTETDLVTRIAADQLSVAKTGDDWYQPGWQYEDTWITDIGTLLYHDDDGDGYFSGFSLTIDADTHYQQADVYAAIDVQRTFEGRERLHTSANFTLYENSLSDEYRIDIDLLKNYPAGDYDLYIELHDAYDHRVLDSVGAREFSNLHRLPLESEDLDIHSVSDYPTDQVHYPDSPLIPVNDDIRVVEYAGSSGFLFLLTMLVLIFLRIIDTQARLRYQCEW